MAWVVERHGAKGTRYRGGYRDPDGRLRSAGTFSTRRDALRAANREEQKVLAGAWHDTTLGEVTFRDYVEGEWLPNKHVEASTRAAYISYLNKHFYPFFGHRQLNRISPSLVQDWVTEAKDAGLSPRSIRKYHVMLSSIFARAVKDRVLVHNPCDHTELPKVITRKARTLTPDEYTRLLAAIPDQHRLMVETLIEAGLRWGELVALKPRHIDFLRRIVDGGGDHRGGLQEATPPPASATCSSPTRRTTNPAPSASARPGSTRSPQHIQTNGIGRDDLLFATRAGTPISRNTFRTRIWLPAVKASGVGFPVRVHDLRHAHASWLLAGGADLKSVMDRMGHSQIQTTQKYLHTLPDTDQRNLDALTRIQDRRL